MSDVTWDDNDVETPENPQSNLEAFPTWALVWSEELEHYYYHKGKKLIGKSVFEMWQTHTNYEDFLIHWKELKKRGIQVEVKTHDDITLPAWRQGKHVMIPEAYEP